jgi:hypothetical protein
MKFLITPTAAGYSTSYGEEVIRTALDGGAGRYRADVLQSAAKVECSWALTAAQFDYMSAFYRLHKKGAVPFEIDLIVDGSELVERVVNIVPGSYQLTGQSGASYFVKATLEVHPIAFSDVADLAIVSAYE